MLHIWGFYSFVKSARIFLNFTWQYKSYPFMSIHWNFLSGLVVLILFSACGEEDTDLVPPSLVIRSVEPTPVQGTICGEPEDSVFVLEGGDTLRIELEFSDDQALSQYKIDIHNNFDCHGHGGGSVPGFVPPEVFNQTEDWTVLEIGQLSGTIQRMQLGYPVPRNTTAGAYHFQLQVLDEAGNDNPLGNIYSIRLFHPDDREPPVITVDEPVGRDLTASKGEMLSFKGRVTDNHSLSAGGNGILFLTYTDRSSGNTFTSNAYSPFGEEVADSFDFELDFTLPTTLVSGAYSLSLRAFDGVRNEAVPVSFDLDLN